MILNHQYRFLFIKTRKTGGSSVEVGLSRICGPGDIVTPLAEKRGEEALRRREGGCLPTGWEKPFAAHRGLREWRRLLLKGERAPRFRSHATAGELTRLLPREVWGSYFKFTIERNPWDRAVSRYWWQRYRFEQRGKSGFPPLGEYLAYLEHERPHWLSNWGHYTIDDEIVVDRVLFYEELSASIDRLRGELGIEGDISLPRERAKGAHRPSGQSYRDVLGPDEKQLVERVCAREIEAFGYRF
jgi:hypothetical protein